VRLNNKKGVRPAVQSTRDKANFTVNIMNVMIPHIIASLQFWIVGSNPTRAGIVCIYVPTVCGECRHRFLCLFTDAL
jgi:hypothetical protein